MVRLSGNVDGTRPKYIETRCLRCWQCVTSKKNDISGKLLAEAAVCAEVWMLTCTYDPNTPQGELGAKIRIPEHVKTMLTRLRQQERRRIRKYNKDETKAAELDGRKPELVDPSRTYITYRQVYELGSENLRGHFHVMIFFQSHFPVELGGADFANVKVCPDQARRVWIPDQIYGPRAPRLPKTANDPSVIDWRVEKSQRHHSWDHGFINAECLSHDKRCEQYKLDPIQHKKPIAELAKGITYMNKYLDPAETKWKDRDRTEEEKKELREKLHKARGGELLHRAGSQRLGREYAEAYGRAMASAGVPLQHVHFRAPGITVPRSHKALTKLEMKLRQHFSGSALQQHMHQAHQMVFQMQGGMLKSCVEEYVRLSQAKGRKEQAYGDVAHMWLRQTQLRKYNEWLRSDEGVFRRHVARDMDAMDTVKIAAIRSDYSKAVNDMVTIVPTERNGVRSLPVRVLPPEPFSVPLDFEPPPNRDQRKAQGIETYEEYDKLIQVRQAGELLGRVYNLVKIDPYKYNVAKANISRLSSVHVPWENTGDKPTEYRTTPDKVYWHNLQAAIQSEFEKFLAGDRSASDHMDAMIAMRGNPIPKQLALPWSVAQNQASARLTLRWLNYSDQYEYPQQRERLLQQFCAVRDLTRTRRVVITPDGRVLMQIKARVNTRMAAPSQRYRAVNHFVRQVDKWGSREIKSSMELAAFKAGRVDRFGLRSIHHGSDPIFKASSAPFLNEWAMAPNELQREVLALPSPDIFDPARVLDRYDPDSIQLAKSEEFIPF